MADNDSQPEPTRVITTGGTVRITEPQPSGKRGKKQRSKASVVVDIVTPKPVDGFVGFLREHAVVSLAVGIVIGTQLKAIVDALNNGFISPLFGLIFGGSSLVNRTNTVEWHGRTATLAWGALVYQIVDFVFVMAIIYALIKLFKLDKLDQPRKP